MESNQPDQAQGADANSRHGPNNQEQNQRVNLKASVGQCKQLFAFSCKVKLERCTITAILPAAVKDETSSSEEDDMDVPAKLTIGSWRPKGRWKCKFCGKRLARKSYLCHMRRHRREKRFHCVQCGKGFITGSEKSVHERIHQPGWQFNCLFCERGFHKKDNLYNHLRSHTEEKPFICEFEGCDASFRHARSLKKHCEQNHQE